MAKKEIAPKAGLMVKVKAKSPHLSAETRSAVKQYGAVGTITRKRKGSDTEYGVRLTGAAAGIPIHRNDFTVLG